MSERSDSNRRALHALKNAARHFTWEQDKARAAAIIAQWTALSDDVAARPGHTKEKIAA